MRSNELMSDLISLSDLDCRAFETIASRAVELAQFWHDGAMPQSLVGLRIGLIEELPGWRNPSALALGAAAMGATCVRLDTGLEGKESLEDLAGYLDNWFNLIGVRTPSLARLRSFADSAVAPVINLRTNDDHPCEILGDLSYVLSERGSWENMRVAVVGPRGNIAKSWIEAAAVLPIQVTQVSPATYAYQADELPPRATATDQKEAVTTADLIVTDCWPTEASADETEHFKALCIDAEILDRAPPHTLFVPCPPVTRGQEVADSAMRHDRCKAKQAKAFLLHTQNAIMERLSRLRGIIG